jgi:hypothetical protein
LKVERLLHFIQGNSSETKQNNLIQHIEGMRDNGCSVGVSMQVKTVATVSSFEHALDDNAAKEMLKDSRLRTTNPPP